MESGRRAISLSWVIVAVLALPSTGTANEPAAARDHWSFRPLRSTAVPSAAEGLSGPATPVDAFIDAKLSGAGARPAPLCDDRTWLRRVHLALIGLPPTIDKQDDFATSTSPERYRQVVDELLSRPEYGERWGRHWLDVARFAETKGYERDETMPQTWRYRDWVIDAFNRDVPYDQFLTHQLAGDRIEGADSASRIASMFLSVGPFDTIVLNKERAKYDQLDDMIATTAQAFLGLTMQCARCHDHKFEPITQADYYRVLGAFSSLSFPAKERDVGGVKAFVFADRKKPTTTHLRIRGDVDRRGPEVEFGLPSALAAENEAAPPDEPPGGRRLWLAAWMTGPGKGLVARVYVNRIWQQHFGRGFVDNANNLGASGGTPSHQELLEWLAADFVETGWRTKRLHKLIVLSNAFRRSSFDTAAKKGATSGDPQGTLYSRWQVRRLEAEAIRDSMLAVSGELNPRRGGPSVFPPIRRKINGTSAGNNWKDSDARSAARRSVYVFAKRAYQPPVLSSLDQPDASTSCEQRHVSTTAVQSLLLLNGRFAWVQAQALAERVTAEAGDAHDDQIDLAVRLVLCRRPHDRERQALARFIDASEADKDTTKAEALSALCLVLLNTNEFAYLN